MKVLLINISLRPNHNVKYLPIGLAYIATALEKSHIDFQIYDMDVNNYSYSDFEEYLSKNKYDIICMGCIVTGYKIAKEICKISRDKCPESIIVVGNSVADSIPEILLTKTEADIAIIGEGDITIVNLLKSLNMDKENPFKDLSDVKGIAYNTANGIVFTEKEIPLQNLDELPFIDYSLWDVERYINYAQNGLNEPLPMPRNEIRAMAINTARGCPFKCHFCYHVFRNIKYRRRSWKKIFDEIEYLMGKYNVNYIHFFDEITFPTIKSVNEFIDEFNNRELHFFWHGTIRGDLFRRESDIELLKKLKETGCEYLGSSLESANEEILKVMNKNLNLDHYRLQIKMLKEANISTATSIVLGYPQETPKTIEETFNFCRENKVYPSIGFALPFPGSELYDYAKELGYIGDEEEFLLELGDRQDLRYNMTQMTSEVFQNIVLDEAKKTVKSLNIDLPTDKLIKSQYRRSSKENE